MRSIVSVCVLIAVGQFGSGAFAQQVAIATNQPDCASDEPDTMQISWNQPCEEGDWLFDTRAGCRMWDWHPDPKDRAVWTGTCEGGKKEGRGAVQWYEHGQPIDRFEGIYRNGKREGFGRYMWTPETSFEGHYANDVPNGFGTATVLGEAFSGTWQNGCFRQDSRVVAIGVARASCAGVAAEIVRKGKGRGKAAF